MRKLLIIAGSALLGFRVAFGCHDGGPSAALRAETEYTTELLHCVDKAKTLQESRDCRQLVDARWGIVEVEAGVRR